MEHNVINTGDGSPTLFLPELDEQYHSINGAITESKHVFLKMGYIYHESKKPSIFEVGFGTGLNCLLTALKAEEQKRLTTYVTIEKFPLENKIIGQLDYGKLISPSAKILFDKIHNCKWNKIVKISKYFKLFKLEADLLLYKFEKTNNFDIIYFDAFGPNKQPEMWQPEVLNKIYSVTALQGVFVTYSAKGLIRRQLSTCGFYMERLPGPPGKFQMLRGIKKVLNT
jgi:tRNA U34 5-methylaminomethyl-2-thiouridine-forming methyltransferase MnmC